MTRALASLVVLAAICLGGIGGAWFATTEPVVSAVDAGVPDAVPETRIAAPREDRMTRLPIASHCTPQSGWPCEP